MVHSGIACTWPHRVRNRKLKLWTVTASTIFLATKDFIDHPRLLSPPA
jgi:hypothetical protein